MTTTTEKKTPASVVSKSDSLGLTLSDTGVLTITLNRPDCLNAIDDDLSFALQDALKQASKLNAVRCVVLTGAGRGFCAGQDLQSRSITATGDNALPHLGESIRKRYTPIILGLRQLEKPVIAAINGVAAGAGASLALACDLRVASENASFIQAFVKVGLIPDSGALWFLPQLVGAGRAMELAMLGDKLDAATALQWGLVNKVVPLEVLMNETLALADRLAQGPTKALGLMKRAVNTGAQRPLPQYMALEADLQEVAGRTNDYRTGVDAFLNKQLPVFSGQ